MTDLLLFVSQFDSIDHIYNLQIPKKDLFSRNCPLSNSQLSQGQSAFPGTPGGTASGNGQHAEVGVGVFSLHYFLAGCYSLTELSVLGVIFSE